MMIAHNENVKTSERITCDCGHCRFYVNFVSSGVVLECVDCGEIMKFTSKEIWIRS